MVGGDFDRDKFREESIKSLLDISKKTISFNRLSDKKLMKFFENSLLELHKRGYEVCKSCMSTIDYARSSDFIPFININEKEIKTKIANIDNTLLVDFRCNEMIDIGYLRGLRRSYVELLWRVKRCLK